LENLKDEELDFIEVMACPSGCIGGGGQPKTKDPDAVLKRMGSVYAIDSQAKIRKAHENKDILQLYETYLGEYGGEKAHKLLHTHYIDRSGNQKADSVS
jgi:NADH-quinone oxidoreductase subunit G